MAYQMLKTQQTYRDLGEDYFDRLDKARTARALVTRLTKLGYKLPLSPIEIECAPRRFSRGAVLPSRFGNPILSELG